MEIQNLADMRDRHSKTIMKPCDEDQKVQADSGFGKRFGHDAFHQFIASLAETTVNDIFFDVGTRVSHVLYQTLPGHHRSGERIATMGTLKHIYVGRFSVNNKRNFTVLALMTLLSPRLFPPSSGRVLFLVNRDCAWMRCRSSISL
ncbi:MAG: hypothetical protein RDV48_29595 [Candidatus Eremiobacteraeota bacterium]|nr:hypothetical protein [Candidatus Eremiobacteraeota bacterium]